MGDLKSLISQFRVVLSSDTKPLFHNIRSTIYSVSEDVVAKVYHEVYPDNFLIDKRGSKNEYDMGIFMFEKGVSVPKMYGLVSPDFLLSRPFIKLSSKSIIKNWVNFMQRIYGIDLRKLDGPKLEEAKILWKIELEKILDLGYCPLDSEDYNVMFDEEKGKVFLIDLVAWRKGSPKELDRLYKKLKNGTNMSVPINF